ncbi:hypothetical protein L2725_22480 [Shewanella corallii]|uniref:Esterase n=1 Tax=Shewanella corallii TaxID=560080 RepID=A0ABT0NDF6_9GAMM|nr:alpha/beta hydrolase-fold protein [Shewanella corallii]MCL2916508.1 hypothetical protein [Shewanella corallii]
MNRMFCVAISLILALVSAPVLADKGIVTEPLSIESPLLGDKPAVFTVTLPEGFDAESEKGYVVMFEQHPAAQALLAGMHHWMGHNGGWPWLHTIVVTAPDGHQGLGKLKGDAIELEGNTALLDFYQESLLPAIDQKYPTNGFRIMNGFTGNAGLVLYTLLNRPELFNAYIAASPVLSKDFAYVLKEGEQNLKRIAPTLAKRSVFLQISTSDSEYEQGQLESYAQLEAMLKAHAPKGLNWRSQRFDGSYYMTQLVLATAHGIEFIFNDIHQPLAADSAVSQQGVEAIVKHYQHLSQQVYGFKVSPSSSLIALAKSNDDPTVQLKVYADSINAEPDYHYLRFNYATALASQGQLDQAKAQLDKAVTLTEHPFWLNKYQEALTKLAGANTGERIKL